MFRLQPTRSLARAGRFGGLLQKAAQGIACIAAQTEAPLPLYIAPDVRSQGLNGQGLAQDDIERVLQVGF